MALPQTAFPLNGVIGIVDSSRTQLDLACQLGLSSVEIRADLLRTAGLSDSGLHALIVEAKASGLACLYTLRHKDQGGTFANDESERIALCSAALEAGADIIDLEYGTDAANEMLQRAAPMILSHHNFDRMLGSAELASLSDKMEAQSPSAVKIIPTGSSLADALTMMVWVANAGYAIKRIGFSMGEDGAVSRILALGRGAPVTYASFGDPVAPGQVDINLLLERYGCMSMTKRTSVTAVVGENANVEQYVESIKNNDDDNVFVRFSPADAATVEACQSDMNVVEIVYL